MLHPLRNLGFLVLLALAPLTVGCGPSTPPAKLANVQPGTMPKDGGWEGVYYSPLFGNLHLKSKGGGVEGRWLTPVKDVCGSLHGTADGNLLKFAWEKYTIGLVGPNSRRSGHGYFAYARPEGENVDDEISGQVGDGGDEVGTEWKAVKQRNVPAAPDSLGCGGGAADVGGGDFDKDSKEKGEPEEPTEPK